MTAAERQRRRRRRVAAEAPFSPEAVVEALTRRYSLERLAAINETLAKVVDRLRLRRRVTIEVRAVDLTEAFAAFKPGK